MLNDGSSVYEEEYQSKLGPFRLCLTSSNGLFQPEEDAAGIHTVGHDILIKALIPPLDWMPAHMHVETAKAWLFYIIKRNPSQEQLTLSMKLQNHAVQGGAETGECLLAIGFDDGIRQIHLGTEDEESMAQRAAVNDWMPPRLERLLLAESSIEVTTITPDGLQTKIPPLEPGEQFYLHYIIAENPCRQFVDHPDQPDISTWFAVEQTKARLERARK